MKNYTIKKYINTIIIIIITLTPKYIFSDDLPIETKTYISQLEEKNKLFKEAMDNFGVINKEQAVKLYAEGIKTRSGPLQYSVMCKQLKCEFENEMNKYQNYAWVTGTSSPWVSEYKVLEYKNIKNNTYSVMIKFTLNDAKGMIEERYTELEVKKINKIWCITNIKNL